MNISKTLKSFRESRGLTQTQMAEMLGLKGQQAYSYYEKNGNDATVSKIIEFGEKLGVDLFAQEGETKNTKNILLENEEKSYKPESKTLNKLIESNYLMAQAAKLNAEGNRDLAKNTLELTLMQKANSNYLQESFPTFDTRLQAILVLLTQVAAGKRYGSAEEALAEIHKHVVVQQAKDEAVYTQTG